MSSKVMAGRGWPAVTALAATALATLASWAAVAAETRRPNIVLLESDDHHYQALRVMGEPLQTPHIDRLAARGVLFRNNVCQGTMCSPSRNALLTGSYPHNTGVYHNRDGNMAADAWTIALALRRAGYTTALVGKSHFKPHSDVAVRDRTAELTTAQLNRLGFDYVHAVAGKVSAATSKLGPGQDPYRDYLRDKGLLDKLQQDYAENRGGGRADYVGASVLPEEHYQDTYIASRAIDFIAAHTGEKPFFLWVDFVAPHPPADAPQPYASMYEAAAMRKPLRGAEGQTAAARRRPASDETYQRFRAAYYGMITLLDAQVGRIVAALEQSGQLDNTVIVFTGDQGSMLGDLGFWGKGVFYKGSINSPLVIAGPAGLVRPGVVDRPVELIDLAPTFLDLAAASSEDRARCRGESLAALLSGRGEYRRSAAFAEDHETKMVVTARYKYIQSPSEALLFDLEADPDELVNLAGKRPEVEAELGRRIAEWLDQTGPVLPPNTVAPNRRRGAGG